MLLTKEDGVMVLTAETTIIKRKVRKGGKDYESFWLYLSKDLMGDSQCPFEGGDTVEIIIDPENKRLIVTKKDTQGEA